MHYESKIVPTRKEAVLLARNTVIERAGSKLERKQSRFFTETILQGNCECGGCEYVLCVYSPLRKPSQVAAVRWCRWCSARPEQQNEQSNQDKQDNQWETITGVKPYRTDTIQQTSPSQDHSERAVLSSDHKENQSSKTEPTIQISNPTPMEPQTEDDIFSELERRLNSI